MTLGRAIILFVILVFIAVGVAITLLVGNLDKIVAAVIEEAGTKATKTEVTVEAVSLEEFTNGKASISGITVASPAGYTEPHILSLGQISVDIDVDSLSASPYTIDEIRIKSPHVAYEIDESGGTNVDTVRKNLPKEEDPEDEKVEPKSSSEDEIRLIIKSFVIEDGEVKVTIAKSGQEPKISKLPRIEIKGIGEKEGGVTPNEAATIIITAIFDQVGPVVLGMDVGKHLNDELQKAQEKAKKELNRKKVKKAVGDTLSGAKKALDGIFGK